MTNILIAQPEARDGCSHYRINQFAGAAKRRGLAEVTFMSDAMPEEDIAEAIKTADVYLMRLHDHSETIVKELRQQPTPKPIILDIDDRYEDLNPFSDHYGYLGTNEIQLTGGQMLWKDGERGFSVKENTARLESFKRVMRSVDGIIVTTFKLAEYAREYNPNVVVIPNAIDPELFPEVRHQKDGKSIKIVWSGGSSHFEDLIEIQPGLKAIMETYPQVEYHHVGQYFKGFVKDLPQNRVKLHRWASPDGHGFRMACIGADIAIAPLKDIVFNEYKSSVKFYEYAALGIPTIARNMEPYTDDIREGETGMFYSSPAEFKEKLEELINDPMLRVKLGENGKKYVRDKRDLYAVTEDWVTFLGAGSVGRVGSKAVLTKNDGDISHPGHDRLEALKEQAV